MAINAYAKIKEAKETDPDITDAMEKVADILGEDEKEVNKVLKQVEEIKVDEDLNIPVIVEEKCINGSCSIEGPGKTPSLKIKALSLTAEGENGFYTATNYGVLLQRDDMAISFENIEQLNRWVEEFKEVFELYNKKVS
jgi:hypothetical protein